MMDFFKEVFQKTMSKWGKILAIIGVIVYAVLYLTSCSAIGKATMSFKNQGDSTYEMSYTTRGRISK